MARLDSHAAYVTADTTKPPYHCGEGWKTNSGGDGRSWASGIWWKERFDPDYQYRLIPALDE